MEAGIVKVELSFLKGLFAEVEETEGRKGDVSGVGEVKDKGGI